MTLIAIDPGVKFCGWAVLRAPETLELAGTWIPKATLSILERHLWLLSRLQDVIAHWQPDVLALEDFVWRTGRQGEQFVRGRPSIERLIGGIEALSLSPPYPVLMLLKPGQWGAQLTGSPTHDKTMVARAVNLRLHTQYQGNHWDNHTCDSVGIGLVALDTLALHAAMHRQRGAVLRGARR